MQTLINYFALLLTGMVLNAQNNVEVTMTNFSNDKGTVKVGLYNNEGDWLEKEFKIVGSKIENNTAKVTFTNVPDGIYAVSCFHDQDNDGVFDMYLGMIPAEDYACSNGATGMFGPPKWSDAKFETKNNETKQITLKL
ncbi:DUF2141 domain-containing protein [Marinirhabdus gelatinilytica]|uniref:Uncharacterized protein (DUF2141 family) n=1 Tax=Marinirhabdus gelatinilytica TaxID=1703343 RepID=A0A370QFI9_9FLAO|nr:DUF2141 domain-containing protein [Marinirhabdus gelatinilytica]RDK87136.1 uncharacterized protein (DUF2141 family) [Marinirhabdus gelatinilytica]